MCSLSKIWACDFNWACDRQTTRLCPLTRDNLKQTNKHGQFLFFSDNQLSNFTKTIIRLRLSKYWRIVVSIHLRLRRIIVKYCIVMARCCAILRYVFINYTSMHSLFNEFCLFVLDCTSTAYFSRSTVTSSSELSPKYSASNAALSSSTAWCPRQNFTNDEYLQVIGNLVHCDDRLSTLDPSS